MKPYDFTTTTDSRSTIYRLIPIGDIHIGTKSCDEKKLFETVRYIKQTPHCYWLGMGDYCDYIKYHDKRFDPADVHPRFRGADDICQAQTDYAASVLAPIKDRCIGLLCGNHEEKNRLAYEHNVTGLLSRALGLEPLGYVTMIRWRFQRKTSGSGTAVQVITIYASHGWGGGRKTGGKLNNIEEVSKFFDADIYLMGHVHEKVSMEKELLEVSGAIGDPILVARKRVFAVTGTYYKTYQVGTCSYAEKMGYPPTPTGSVKITIEPWVEKTVNGKSRNAPPNIYLTK